MHPMYNQPSTPARDAPHSFDERSANVTLCTSDSDHFHVHTQILSQVSPFFATMFGLPQPAAPPDSPPEGPEDPHAGIRPVIHVAEDSKALEPLLRLCYPVPKPELHYLDEIQPVLAAAIKYDMESPTEELAARFIECTTQCPLQVWAFGCRHGLKHIARGGAEDLRASLSRGAREGLSFLPEYRRACRAWTASLRGSTSVCCSSSAAGAAAENAAAARAGQGPLTHAGTRMRSRL